MTVEEDPSGERSELGEEVPNEEELGVNSASHTPRPDMQADEPSEDTARGA